MPMLLCQTSRSFCFIRCFCHSHCAPWWSLYNVQKKERENNLHSNAQVQNEQLNNHESNWPLHLLPKGFLDPIFQQGCWELWKEHDQHANLPCSNCSFTHESSPSPHHLRPFAQSLNQTLYWAAWWLCSTTYRISYIICFVYYIVRNTWNQPTKPAFCHTSEWEA